VSGAEVVEAAAGIDETVTGCGARLRQAREAAGLSLEQAARRVHLTTRVLNALEAEAWEQIGAPIFVRGHLRSYAQILGLDAHELLEQAHVSQLQSPTLHSGMAENVYSAEMRPHIGRSLLIALAILVLAAPILWHVLQPPDNVMTPAAVISTPTLSQQEALPEQALIEFTHIAPIHPPINENELETEHGAEVEGEAVTEFEDETSDTPESVSISSTESTSTPFLSLSFRAESWVEIRAANGSLLESGLIAAGQERQFEPGQIGRIKLGNASGVEVRQAGERVETSRLGRGNVVHFRVSLDGSVQPVAAQ